LHYAALDGAPNELIQVLIDAGANIHATTHDGKTPVDLARERSQVATVEFLNSFMPMSKAANRVV
jgi:ankyrin repeat protein